MSDQKGWHKATIAIEKYATKPIEIVGDAAVATKSFDNGKMVPLLRVY
jgi:hypothetical protein